MDFRTKAAGGLAPFSNSQKLLKECEDQKAQIVPKKALFKSLWVIKINDTISMY